MADAFLVLSGEGIKASERKQLLRGSEREIQRMIRNEFMPALARTAIRHLRREAPKWTGRMQEGIRITGQSASRDRPSIRVGVTATSDRGFPYVSATRFGRKAVEAKGRSTPARTYRMPERGVMGGGQRRPFRARMLSFEHTETVDPIYRRRSRAYKPGGDWVRRAEPAIRVETKETFEVIAEEIQEAIERTSFITGKPTGRGAARHKGTVRRIK